MRIAALSCALLTLTLTAACRARTADITDAEGFMAAVRAAGASVEPAGEVTQPFFSVPGRLVRLNGSDVQLFEYPSAEAAAAEAGRISPDGTTIGGTTSVQWIGPPHFYRRGGLIVLYVGADRNILDLLDRLIGPQIAGV